MSNRKLRRRANPSRCQVSDRNVDTGVMCGWSEHESGIEEVKKVTHDQLIASMGQRRRSGVRWLIHNGDEALDAVSRLSDGASPEYLRKVIRPIQDRLRQFGGYLVVAMADGEP